MYEMEGRGWRRFKYDGNKNGRQCRYNVTLRRVRATTVAVEKQQVLHILSMCIFSLSCSACNTHAPYFYLWPARHFCIFPHCLINDAIFERNVLKIECVIIFSALLSETFLILRRIELLIDMIKNVQRSSCKVPVILVRF